MPKHTSKSAKKSKASPLPSFQELIYDFLMSGIEPELTTGQTRTLEEKYQDETPEQAKARAARYTEAFKTYDALLAEWVANYRLLERKDNRVARKNSENDQLTREASDIAKLESAIRSSSSDTL